MKMMKTQFSAKNEKAGQDRGSDGESRWKLLKKNCRKNLRKKRPLQSLKRQNKKNVSKQNTPLT